MKDVFHKFQSAFEQRVLRERVIIAVVVLALIYFVFDILMFQSTNAKRASLESRSQAAQNELNVLSTEKQVLAGALANNPNIAKQREIANLKERVKSLNKDIDTLSDGLIPADELPAVIREVLTPENKVKLLGLLVPKPEALSFQRDDGETEAEAESAGVFKHAVIFRVGGSYFDIMNYLQSLESSPWNFYWEELDYHVDIYPNAVAQVRAYTLSTERGFIGE